MAAQQKELATQAATLSSQQAEIEAKAKTIADLEKRVEDVTAMRKELAMAAAQQREEGFYLGPKPSPLSCPKSRLELHGDFQRNHRH